MTVVSVAPTKSVVERTFSAMTVREFLKLRSTEPGVLDSEEGQATVDQIYELFLEQADSLNCQLPYLESIAAIRLVPEFRFRQTHGVDAIMVQSFNVSCQCEPLDLTRDMVGMCIYAYKGKTDWRLNGVHCKAGYIVIKLADSLANVSSRHGAVHGKLYKSVFGQEPDEDVIATGFAIRRGAWRFNSGTFNVKYTSCHMAEAEQQVIKAAVQRRFRPGATHADKIFPILELADKIVVVPS